MITHGAGCLISRQAIHGGKSGLLEPTRPGSHSTVGYFPRGRGW